MRIGFFILHLNKQGGGSNQNAIALIRGLRSLGHEVSVTTLFERSNNLPDDIKATTRPGEGLGFLALQREIAEALTSSEKSADVFFVYGQALLWGAGMYRKKGSVPTAVYLDSHLDAMKESYRDTGMFHRLRHFAWAKLRGIALGSCSDHLFACSPYLLEKFVAFGFPRAKFSIVPDAFDFEAPLAHVNSKNFRMLYVGRLSSEKGVDTLIEACALLPTTQSWQLKLIGLGTERERAQEMIDEKNLRERVSIAGWMDRRALAQAYAAADLLIVPSRVPEPFGRTVVEAMQAGVPVVVPKKGGAAWVAGDGGVAFDNGDPESLKNAIASIMSDASARQKMVAAGLQRAGEFAVRPVVEHLAAALAEMKGR